MKKNQRFKPNEDVAYRDIDGNFLILHPFSDQSHELNNVASLIWRGIIEHLTLAEIHSGIVAEFKVSEEEAWTDLEVFLTELDDLDLVRSVAAL